MDNEPTNIGKLPTEQRITAISEMEKAAAVEKQRLISELEFCLETDIAALVRSHGDKRPVSDLLAKIMDNVSIF